MEDISFATKDLNEAAYLYVEGNTNFPRLPEDWDGIERSGSQVWFYFGNTDQRREQRVAYNTNIAVINVRNFIVARGKLLDIINATK